MVVVMLQPPHVGFIASDYTKPSPMLPVIKLWSQDSALWKIDTSGVFARRGERSEAVDDTKIF